MAWVLVGPGAVSLAQEADDEPTPTESEPTGQSADPTVAPSDQPTDPPTGGPSDAPTPGPSETPAPSETDEDAALASLSFVIVPTDDLVVVDQGIGVAFLDLVVRLANVGDVPFEHVEVAMDRVGPLTDEPATVAPGAGLDLVTTVLVDLADADAGEVSVTASVTFERAGEAVTHTTTASIPVVIVATSSTIIEREPPDDADGDADASEAPNGHPSDGADDGPGVATAEDPEVVEVLGEVLEQPEAEPAPTLPVTGPGGAMALLGLAAGALGGGGAVLGLGRRGQAVRRR